MGAEMDVVQAQRVQVQVELQHPVNNECCEAGGIVVDVRAAQRGRREGVMSSRGYSAGRADLAEHGAGA